MTMPRRPTPDPDYDSGRRQLTLSGTRVSAALTDLPAADPGRRHGATHILTVTPRVTVAPRTIVDVDGVRYRVIATRPHATLKRFAEVLVTPEAGGA